MRFSSSILCATLATLSLGAPLKFKRQAISLASLLSGSNSFNSLNSGIDISSLLSSFEANSFNLNDLSGLLSSFDLNSFNNDVSGAFNDQQIAALLISLEGNQFNNSNLQSIGNSNAFDLNAFSQNFNSQFSASWQVSQIEDLLLELGLVSSNSFGNVNGLNNANLSNSDLNSVSVSTIAVSV